jgi:hypothetical protein
MPRKVSKVSTVPFQALTYCVCPDFARLDFVPYALCDSKQVVRDMERSLCHSVCIALSGLPHTYDNA